jgi:large subunit ribosomal protein L40
VSQPKSDTTCNILSHLDLYASLGTQISNTLQHVEHNKLISHPSNRALRHWTIHRAWQLYQSKLRIQHQLDLERQYNSMASACEALRLIDTHGLTAEERFKLGEGEAEGNQMGKLFRIAMLKKGIWDGVPIEYARIQTETPPKDGWNHSWTR